MKLNRLVIVSAILTFLIIAASLFKPGFLWSINLPGYLSLFHSVLIAISALIVYLLLSQFSQTRYKPQDNSDLIIKRIAIIFFSAALLVIIFYQFRSATMLLGDGYLRANETNLGSKLHFTEPLDKFLQFIVYNTLGSWFGLKSFQTHQIVSIFGGILYFLFGIWFSGRYGKSQSEKILMGGLLFSSALIQIFFGYVESYSISTPFLLFAVGLIYLELKSNRSILPGLLVYFIACLFHMSLFAYYPAFLVLAIILWRSSDKNNGAADFIGALIIPILLISMVVVLNNLQFGGSFRQNIFDYLIIPLIPNDFGYWLFSPRHLLDILNQLLLVSPAAIIIFAALNPFQKQFYKTRLNLFIGLMSICGIGFLLLFATSFGIGRDWDLFSSIAIPLNILAGIILIQGLSSVEDYSAWKKFSPLLPALIISFAFVIVNSQEKPSLERYKDIISQIEYGRHLNLENLGNYYLMENDTANYYDALRGAGNYQDHPRYQHKIAMKLLEDGRTEEAVEHFYKALQIDSAYLPTLNYLGITYALIGEKDSRAYDLAENYFRMVENYDPDYPHIHHNLGGVYHQTKRYERALEEYRLEIEKDRNYLPAYEKMGLTFARTGQYDSSEYYYRHVIDHNSDRFESYIYLAKMLHSSGQKDKATEILSDAEKHFGDFDKLTEISKTYAQINSYNNAVRLLEELTENPSSPLEAHTTLANLYNQLNKKIRGISILSLAGERNPDPGSLVSIAETFLQLGAPDSAEVYLLNSISRDQSFYLGYRKLGTFYLLHDQKEKARQVLEMGMANIDDPEHRQSLASLLERINNF
ncbi:MAG: hypothetical protein GF310_03975 [candidate division Zixibacteria bacterium]|nr:hypothetical protein [candidate division Zixibacteria bacterium]